MKGIILTLFLLLIISFSFGCIEMLEKSPQQQETDSSTVLPSSNNESINNSSNDQSWNERWEYWQRTAEERMKR